MLLINTCQVIRKVTEETENESEKKKHRWMDHATDKQMSRQ